MKPINGVVIGIVTQVRHGEVKVKFPWLHERDDEERESNWARIATAMAGNGRGTFLMPEVNDEVLVAFEQGDFNHPYVVGFLWNGKDQPPETDTKTRMIKSTSGHVIEFDDNLGQEKILIESHGSQQIEIKDVPAGKITIKTKTGNAIEIDDMSGSISIKALTSIKLSATATITLDAPMINLGTMAFITPGAFTIQAPQVSITGISQTQINSPSVQITGATQTQITGPTTIIGYTPPTPATTLTGAKLIIS